MAEPESALPLAPGSDPTQELLPSREPTDFGIEESRREGRLTKTLLLAVIAATVGSSFQFGYHIGCVNAPGNLITQWYKYSHFQLYNATLTDDEANLQWSISVGIFAVGGMIGGLLSGWMADHFGRKGALLLNNAIALIAAALMSLAKYVGVYYMVTAGRLIIGVSCGLSSGLVPMYLTEISPINLRGSIGSVHQLLVTISILVAQILGLPALLGNERLWPYIFAFTVLPCIFQLATLTMCPESPKYTLINKRNEKKAESDLKNLRGREVQADLDALRAEASGSTEQEHKMTFAAMFKGALRWPLIIAVMMMFSQQLSGINVAMFYSTRIFQDAGLQGQWPFYATILMGAINVAMTLVSMWLVDHPKFGRRSLHLTGLVGMFIAAILIVFSMSMRGADAQGRPEREWASYLSILFVLLFVIAFATGPGSIPWFFVSEIFPASARGHANSIAVMANWAANFVVATFFLPLNALLGQYTFLVFAGMLVFFIFFTYKYVPETKGKTIEEINRDMRKTA